MNKRKFLSSKALAATTKIIATLAALLILAPVIKNVNTVRSSEIDALLYKYLDEYNSAIREDTDMAGIIVSAETDPDALTEANKQIYLAYQKKFFDEWEVAWTYHRAGQLDGDRWDTWNTWFVEEAIRRPEFGWVQNRMHYSGYFLRHVEDSMEISQRGSKIAETSRLSTIG